MSKRKVGRYVIAAAYTGLMGAAAANMYSKIGQTPDTITPDNFKKGVFAASLFTGMVWTIALL